jgi:hypothetical protein
LQNVYCINSLKTPIIGISHLESKAPVVPWFRLTLEPNGYTFITKGNITVFKAKLKYEGLVYRYLDEAQGELIPVYLGNISLVRPYFLNIGVRIIYILFILWAGKQVYKDLILAIGRDLAVETSRAVIKILDYGIEYRNIRPPNVL